MYPVRPGLGGPALEVKVDENIRVKKGDVLVTIDPADYQQRVNAAEAALFAAQDQVTAPRAGGGTATPNVRTAQTGIGVSQANHARPPT